MAHIPGSKDRCRLPALNSSNRHQEKRAFIRLKTQGLFNLIVSKGANHDSPKVERYGLEVNVLSCMARLHENVADSPLAIFAGSAFENGANRYRRGRAGDHRLAESCHGKVVSYISFVLMQDCVICAIVTVGPAG